MINPPQQFGRYQLQRFIGGGHAQVYLAQHPKHGQVALKLLPPGYGMNRETEQRFLREARLLEQMQHPNVLRMLDAGSYEVAGQGRYFFIATEYLPDGSLYDLLQRNQGPLREEVALFLAVQVADALAYTHDLGIIHRDLKPSNIMLRGGQPVLGDFGLARALGEQTFAHDQRPRGTLAYMSPEQTFGDQRYVRRGSDIYSFGVVLYELLSGCQPRNNPDLAAVVLLQMIREVPFPPLQQLAPHSSVEVAAVVDACIQPQRERRYPTMQAVAVALRQAGAQRGYQLPEPPLLSNGPTARPWLLWLLIGGISVTVILLLLIIIVALVLRVPAPAPGSV